jgi:hypothetical protein
MEDSFLWCSLGCPKDFNAKDYYVYEDEEEEESAMPENEVGQSDYDDYGGGDIERGVNPLHSGASAAGGSSRKRGEGSSEPQEGDADGLGYSTSRSPTAKDGANINPLMKSRSAVQSRSRIASPPSARGKPRPTDNIQLEQPRAPVRPVEPRLSANPKSIEMTAEAPKGTKPSDKYEKLLEMAIPHDRVAATMVKDGVADTVDEALGVLVQYYNVVLE